jgi:hypothetical protein
MANMRLISLDDGAGSDNCFAAALMVAPVSCCAGRFAGTNELDGLRGSLRSGSRQFLPWLRMVCRVSRLPIHYV